MSRIARIAGGMIVALAWGSSVHAQQVVSSLDELQPLRDTKAKVTVTDASGHEFRGIIAEASRTQLSLRLGSETRQFAADDVRSVRVRKEDSLLNGALIGAGVLGGLTSLIFLDNECRSDPSCYTAVAVYAGAGALAGLGIDAMIHRQVVVYTASRSNGQRAFTVAPWAARGRTGVRVSIAF